MEAVVEKVGKRKPNDDSACVNDNESNEKLPFIARRNDHGKSSGARVQAAGAVATAPTQNVDSSILLDKLEESDILMGRGKRTNNRSANTYLRERAEDAALTYARLTTKKEKRDFSRKFIDDIEIQGARFVEGVTVLPNGSSKTAYRIVPRNIVEVKIKQLLRDRAAILLAKSQRDSLINSASLMGRTASIAAGGPVGFAVDIASRERLLASARALPSWMAPSQIPSLWGSSTGTDISRLEQLLILQQQQQAGELQLYGGLRGIDSVQTDSERVLAGAMTRQLLSLPNSYQDQRLNFNSAFHQSLGRSGLTSTPGTRNTTTLGNFSDLQEAAQLQAAVQSFQSNRSMEASNERSPSYDGGAERPLESLSMQQQADVARLPFHGLGATEQQQPLLQQEAQLLRQLQSQRAVTELLLRRQQGTLPIDSVMSLSTLPLTAAAAAPPATATTHSFLRLLGQEQNPQNRRASFPSVSGYEQPGVDRSSRKSSRSTGKRKAPPPRSSTAPTPLPKR